MTTKTKVSCKFRYFKLAKTLRKSKTFGFFTGNALRARAGEACTSARLGSYVRRWARWTTAGLAVADVSTPIGAAAG